MTNPTDPLAVLSTTVRTSFHGFLDVYEPLRGELYRYCRHLTRSPWDAEDLAQDTLARAFVTLGRMGEAPPNPRAWLFRVASNLWIDHARRRREVATEGTAVVAAPEPRAPREAMGTLLVRLSPQERAAVVLKDVFEMTLEEIAEALATSVGAVKAALYRGRAKLVEPEPEPVANAAGVSESRSPARGVLDAFCAAFNARDVPAITALLLDHATVEIVGATTASGPTAMRDGMVNGMMFGTRRLAEAETRGGIDARFVQGALPDSPRAEVRLYRDEPVVLLWYAHRDGELVRAVNRFTTDGDRIAGLQNFFFTPDLVGEVCGELGVPWRANGYRWWLTGRC